MGTETDLLWSTSDTAELYDSEMVYKFIRLVQENLIGMSISIETMLNETSIDYIYYKTYYVSYVLFYLPTKINLQQRGLCWHLACVVSM